MPVLLPVLPRPRLPKLVSPVLPVAQVLGLMETIVTPPLYDYLAFPSHERPPSRCRLVKVRWSGSPTG